jgi:hypothetical protein
MLIEKFQRDHATNIPSRTGRQTIIATQMPPVPVIRSLYGEIVRSLNANARPNLRIHELGSTPEGLHYTGVAEAAWAAGDCHLNLAIVRSRSTGGEDSEKHRARLP